MTVGMLCTHNSIAFFTQGYLYVKDPGDLFHLGQGLHCVHHLSDTAKSKINVIRYTTLRAYTKSSQVCVKYLGTF